MALVQANGQTGLCRRFLSHLDDCRLVENLSRNFVVERGGVKRRLFFFSLPKGNSTALVGNFGECVGRVGVSNFPGGVCGSRARG